MTVALVADRGPEVGLGHVRRIEALAAALGALGIATRTDTTATDAAPGVDALIVDSYRFRADDRHRYAAPIVVAIDELGRDLAVDLVVDPTPGAVADPAAQAGTTLAGAAYALLDPTYATAPVSTRDEVERVLVTFGASPAASSALATARAIALDHPGMTVTLALGPWVDRDSVDPAVIVVDRPTGLATDLADADLVVTAGGVTLLEACAAARPVVAVCLADNQQRAVTALAASGAVVAALLGEVPQQVEALVEDGRRRRTLAATAREIVDGRGAARVAQAVAELVAARR